MPIQKVNTEAIAAAAANISSANTSINQAFDPIISQKNTLEASWNSPAGDAAQTLLNELLRGNDARSTVMQNYVSTLQQVVSPGYDQGETQNTKLADLFL